MPLFDTVWVTLFVGKCAGLVFGRLSVEELVEVFKGKKIEEIDSILGVLPKSFSLAVGKALYPGQWAVLLDSNRKQRPIEMNLLKDLKKKAVELSPLRKDSEIQEFFRDLDISRYLDIATYRDEKEFYMALPEDSRIKKERVPFYKIFEAKEEVIKLMASDLGVKDWLYLLLYAETIERELCFKAMPERLTFMVKEELSLFNIEQLDTELLRKTKKKVIHSFLTHSEHLKWQKKHDLQQDDSNKKEVSDDKAA